MMKTGFLITISAIIVLFGCEHKNSKLSIENDKKIVEAIIHDLTAWALTKDFDRLDSIMTHDDDLFFFQQRSTGDIKGYEAFRGLYKWWKDPRFKADHYELRELRVVFSKSGDVAWFSAYLDDCLQWDGKAFCLSDTRWTGVLERRNQRWVMVQMHYSFASDKVLEEERKKKESGKDGL